MGNLRQFPFGDILIIKHIDDELEQLVFDLLITRLDSPSTVLELSQRLGIDHRNTSKAVNLLRQRGIPIVSGQYGIWITTDPHVAKDWYVDQHAQAVKAYLNIKNFCEEGQRTVRSILQTDIVKTESVPWYKHKFWKLW